MAKQAKTAIKANKGSQDENAKSWTKVIRTVRSPKSGSFAFKESIVHKDKVKDFLAGK